MSTFPRFKCSFPNCSFTAKRLALLKNHIRNHSEDKPFKCRYCTYSTQSRSNCKVHEQRMHTFQRPHKCQYCPYCCVQSSTLRQHVQIKHKDRCQYRCFKCNNFHCQREGQLTFHLLKIHQISEITDITPYLNPNYAPGGMFSGGSGYSTGQVDNMAYSLGKLSQPQHLSSQNTMNAPVPSQPASQYKPMKSKHNEFTLNTVPTLMMQRPEQSLASQGIASSTAMTHSSWTSNMNARRPYSRQEKKANRQASQNDFSDRSLVAGSSIIKPLDDSSEVIEIENEDEVVTLSDEGKQNCPQLQQAENHIFMCNQCLMTFTTEDSFMSHMVANHSDTAILDHIESCEENLQSLEESPHQDNITSSSTAAYSFTTNQAMMLDTSPVPVAISQNNFAAPIPVKQEQEVQLSSPTLQESWLPVSDRDPRAGGDAVSQRLGSDSTTESAFSNTAPSQIHGRAASHDGSVGQSREDTPMFDMPSPTTTNSNIASTSTQTIPLSLNRGGTTINQSRYCCAHCNITFPDNVLFTIHRGAHGFHSPFECNFCGKDCGNKYEFASHLHNCS
ncbi:zinc finger protein Pegasus-like [Asterias rubens]|uniref:zinc finger protein Pegasus-like n=1 Tax=Asterias rubens TaxID=7604 RepID=UPI001455AD07|nr:zinc finger protein Pegasus-like [Asterias rubens]